MIIHREIMKEEVAGHHAGPWLFALILCLCGEVFAAGINDVDKELALILSEEGDARSSAIEFRRLAMGVDDPAHQAGFYWFAAYKYLHAGEYAVSDQLIDQAEDAWTGIEMPALLLRGEAARRKDNRSAAGFYWSALLRGAPDNEQEVFVRRRLAALRLEEGRLEEARSILLEGPIDESHALQALEQHQQGRDKRPAVGGLLGLIPGMGYAYAGEYANAFRSLILNALFIYGMVDTAQNNHWGGFAVITFFEITWYTGSIYGGIDASHRYNQRRLRETVHAIEGNAAFTPDWAAVPVISLNFAF